MFTTSESVPSILPENFSEKRVTFYHISWQAYEQILEALGDNRAAHITYYQGIMEIMSPLEEHESASDLLGIMIHILTEELNLNVKSMAATTLRIPELKIGTEPDKCYYIQNEPAVRGKTVDLASDPPPDLVLEVDITHTDINKNKMYQDMKFPEFWRYNGKTLTIYLWQNNQYQESEISPTFPGLTKSMVYEFLAECKTQGETQTKRVFRERVKEQIKK